MLFAVIALLAALLAPPPVPRPVSSTHLKGTSLCLSVRPGTVVLLDRPGPGWTWQTFDGKQLWFAVPADSNNQDRIYVSRFGQLPDRETVVRDVNNEPRKNHWPQGYSSLLTDFGQSSVPVPRSLRYVVTTVHAGSQMNFRVVYYTPEGFRFEDSLAHDVPGTPFTTVMRSYRREDTTCGEEP